MSSANAPLHEALAKRKEALQAVRERRKLGKLKLEEGDRRPEFLRWLWWKFAKFQNKLRWRKPRGKDNPVRLKLKGYPPMPSSGYGSPTEVRGLHPSGLIPVVVSNVSELERCDPSKHIVYIASTVSLKKRLELMMRARQKGFKVANA